MPKDLYIGIDVGGTKISNAIVNENGKILCRQKDRPDKDMDGREVTQLIISLIQESLDETHLDAKDIVGIGIGVPGLVDTESNRIINTPNSSLSGVDLAKIVQNKTGITTFIGNDVNVGLLGEMWLGAAKNITHVVSLFMGTGLGAGVVTHNHLLTGYQGAAAEIGHMIVHPEGPKCSCGGRGCLEAYVGRWAIERDIKQAIKDGEKSVVTELTEGDLKAIKSKVLFKSLERKDPLVTRVMTQASDAMGTACISLRHIFDPELFILGGGVVEACGDFIIPRVEKILQSDKFFSPLKPCRVVKSILGDDAVILGGVALVKRTLEKSLV